MEPIKVSLVGFGFVFLMFLVVALSVTVQYLSCILKIQYIGNILESIFRRRNRYEDEQSFILCYAVPWHRGQKL